MTPEEEMQKFADSFDWRDGFRSLVEEGKSNREIVEALDLTNGGAIKRASAMRTAQRYRKLVTGGSGQTRGGRKGPQDTRVLEALKRRAAADKLRKPMVIGWKAAVNVKSNSKGAGTRGQDLAPFGGANAAADALERGDYGEAGGAFSRALMQQYGAESFLEVKSFERLDLQY
ncbi:hypothetical protein FsymDg_4550 (plasmid) [Candidatus Protofrankia datiscae]|uniref:Uncharacterized protein n=1 Tax=Candidatus Protofrankia datiscae TaxID=2716812 RepID=F8B6R4_9ACTN|nr:hypothetical protein [Candidatus Protofrankia datiscae]AEH11797.1 hypothetical protein FsymDg_4550 [Candidatus Protofrankia datiscae]